MKLIIPEGLQALLVPHLETVAPPLEVVLTNDEGEPLDDIADAEVLLRWWYSPEQIRHLLALAPNLRWIHTASAGVDEVIIPELAERGILLTNSAGAQSPPIAEFVLMAMLNHAKQTAALQLAQRERRWQYDLKLAELTGKTLLIIGLGSIGADIARRAAAFDMRVLGSRRTPQPVPGVERVVGEGEWRQLLPEADYLVVAAPLTAATRRMVDADALARLSPHAYLINIARGDIIDEDALLETLRAGRIAGALLDVFATEPLPPDSPFWDLPHVTVTPHISWSSPLVRGRYVAFFIENLRRYISGQELLNLVDLHAGY